MRYQITIELDNDVFQSTAALEIAHVLAPILRRAYNDEPRRVYEGTLVDSNGNTVGKAEVVV